MTTTSTFKGLSDDGKPTSRVLKPPGGGSSNIFGTESTPAASNPRAGPNKKPVDSNIFGAGAGVRSESDTQQSAGRNRSARDGENSFNRLFGETDSLSACKQKGMSASHQVNTHENLFGGEPLMHVSEKGQAHSPKWANTHSNLFGFQDYAAQGEGSPVGSVTQIQHSNGTGRFAGKGRGSYNPITGNDYGDLVPTHHALNVREPPKPQKEQPPLPCSDDQYQVREGKCTNVHTSARVTNPPGGKTHKLW